MACENCTVVVTNIVGTPTEYRVKFAGGDEAVIAERITAQDIRTTGLSITVGGPGHSSLGQYWSGNDITIRFENYYNSECFKLETWSCEPVVTTTTPSVDCCDGFPYTIATTGTFDPQDPLAGFQTFGFAVGTFRQTLDPDGEGWTVDSPGTGKICFDNVVGPDLEGEAQEWSCWLRLSTGVFVEADGQTPQTGLPQVVGTVNMVRRFSNASENEITYVSPAINTVTGNPICFRGNLDPGSSLVTLEEVTS